METTGYKKNIWVVGTIALGCIAFAAVAFGINNLDAVKHPNGQVASISVSGEGEVVTIPDIATVTFTVRESAKTVPEAQKLAEAKVAAGLKGLEALGVEKKDTKTISYNVGPKYESQQTGYCNGYICPPVKTVVTGYEVTETISVKIRKIDQAGSVIGILGKANITEMSGPEFTVDDMDKAKEDAKKEAIKKAQAKAKVEADALGVSLGAIISFSEDGGYYPAPMMYKAEAMSTAGAPADDVSLPQGENTIKSRVTITYTIK